MNESTVEFMVFNRLLKVIFSVQKCVSPLLAHLSIGLYVWGDASTGPSLDITQAKVSTSPPLWLSK